MGRFVSKQPNGKYCIFSTIVDTIVEDNMTEKQYIKRCKQEAVKTAKYTLKHRLQPFIKIKDNFLPSNQTVDSFNEWLKSVGDKEPLDKSLYEHEEDEE